MDKRVIAYSDAPVFGGHEVMAIEAIKGLCADGYQVTVVIFEGNEKLSRALDNLSGVDVVTTAVRYKRAHTLTPWLFRAQQQELGATFANTGAKLLLLLQGRIEAGTLALRAGKAAGMTCLSYTPLAHASAIVSGNAAIGAVQDMVNRRAYREMDGFITCYQGARRDILSWDRKARVVVVPNPIADVEHTAPAERTEFGLSAKSTLIGMVGRVEFRQKRHDWVVRNFEALTAGIADPRLVVVGEGPDHEQLRSMVSEHGLEEKIVLYGWSDQPGRLVAAMDVLLIPSSFEGEPLTMLEAIGRHVPVTAAAIDGMADLLPRELLFAPGDTDGANGAIRRALAMQPSAWEKFCDSAAAERTLAKFHAGFAAAVATLLDPRT